MRFLFAGGMPDDALICALTDLGHEVHDSREWDWYTYYIDGHSMPQDWGTKIMATVQKIRPDVFVLSKGGLWRNGNFWKVDNAALWWVKSHVHKMVYLCYDDPAFAPVSIQERIIAPFDLWGTSCPGVRDIFLHYGNPRVFESWLAWDSRIPTPIAYEPEFDVDLAITGTPYYRPFPPPHYQKGFGFPRKDLVRATIAGGFSVGLWGTEQWMDGEQGGDPEFRPFYRGRLPVTEIHRVHRSAKVVLGTHLVEGHRYDSGRLPWVGGAGGCLLHERRPGLEEEFGERVAWFEVGNVKDCLEQLRELINAPARRQKMAMDLQSYVLEHHTWHARAKQLIAEIQA